MKYKISETTEEERINIVEKALSISLSGANAPSKETLDLVNDYIEGRKELEEIQKIIIGKYKKQGEEAQ